MDSLSSYYTHIGICTHVIHMFSEQYSLSDAWFSVNPFVVYTD